MLIPCTPEHFIYLNRVIYAYLEGSKVPHEIVIVLSDCNKVPDIYKVVFEQQFPNVKVSYYPKLLYTGAACSLGEKHCTGDIIMIQAADDLPHHLRVAVVENYFETYDIVALNHSYYGRNMMEYYGIETLEDKFDYTETKAVQPWELYKHHFEDGNIHDVYGQNCGFHVAAGTICYRKEIVGKFTWSNKKHGQDTITCKRILHHFKKSIVIDAPLYYYFK
ncbi:MAG TPA: glycosyltransferase family A protein [Anaerolineae bacterium]|nr:glycosyltransferase family A protein [Anaerolineae bacterium]